MNQTPKPDLLVFADGDHVTAFRADHASARYLVQIPLRLPGTPSLAPAAVARLVRGGDFARVLLSRATDVAEADNLGDLDLRIPVVDLPPPAVLLAALRHPLGLEDVPETGWQPIPEKRPDARL